MKALTILIIFIVAPWSIARPFNSRIENLRRSSAVTEIQSWNSGISSTDRHTKYCKMAASPFIFYRGTNHLFWKDFHGDNRLSQFGNGNTKVWLQGDLHAENFGSYHNDDDKIVYDLNDFDESVVDDYQYDIWRMAISLVLVARQNGGFSASSVDTILDAFSESYLDNMKSYRGNNLELAQIYTESNTYGRLDNFLADVSSKENRQKMLDKWTNIVNNERQFDLTYEKLEAATYSEKNSIINTMSSYGNTLSGKISYSSSYFRVKDVARRILAGTGSLGTPRFYVLIEGASSSENDDHILDVKLQGKPTPYQYWDFLTRLTYDSDFNNDAERHAIAYKALTISTDDLLGWMNFNGGYYSVRERSPYKENFDLTDLNSLTRFVNLAEQWGAILATDHARSDKDFNSNYISVSVDKEIDLVTDGKHSDFRSLVRTIAISYADTVEDDYNSFITSGLTSSC